MRKLALNDEILLKIEKPARYIGGEYNSVMKDPEKVDVRFAMCFPDVCEIGCYAVFTVSNSPQKQDIFVLIHTA